MIIMMRKKGQSPYKSLRDSTGQATVELAIFGTLILLAFSALLTYGQSLDLRQKAKMEAFRKALQMAYYKNSSVSYTLKQDARMVDLFSGYGLGVPTTTSASSTVMWQKGAPGSQGSDNESSFAYYQINNNVVELERKEKTIIGNTGNEQEVTVPVSIWKEEAKRKSDYSSTADRRETTADIRNKRAADLRETLTAALYTRFDNTKSDARSSSDDETTPDYTYNPTPLSLYDDADIHKERTWTTAQ